MTAPLPREAIRFLESFRFGSERAWDDNTDLGDTAVEQIMVLGDIHGDYKVFAAALKLATAEECDVLVQVGDFWLEDSTWRRWAPRKAHLMHAALQAPVPVVVIDGNHEGWPCLTGFRESNNAATAQRTGRPAHLGGSLWWADRGSVWNWAGRRFGALGGTVSPDKWDPKLAKHRWDEETTTQADLKRLIDNAPDGLDVLICHDAPADTAGLIGRMHTTEDLEREAAQMRELLQSAVDATAPSLVFHGHWHQQNRCRINHDTTEVIGLAAAGNPGSAAILSITTLQTRYVHPLGRPTGPRRTR